MGYVRAVVKLHVSEGRSWHVTLPQEISLNAGGVSRNIIRKPTSSESIKTQISCKFLLCNNVMPAETLKNGKLKKIYIRVYILNFIASKFLERQLHVRRQQYTTSGAATSRVVFETI